MSEYREGGHAGNGDYAGSGGHTGSGGHAGTGGHTGDPVEAMVTGHPAVDAAVRALAEVADAAPADQLPAYQAAHRTLQETLASIDEEG